VEHVFGGLLEIGIAGDCWKSNLFGEKIDLQYIAFVHGVGEVALPTTVVFEGRTDIPTNLAVFTEGGAGFSGGMSNDLGAHGGKRSAVEIELTEKGCVGRERWVDARRPEQVESQSGLRE